MKPYNPIFLIFCLLIWSSSSRAQYTADLSKVIPPSPTSASLGNFGNNSKGTYNGVPEITIPILNTRAGGQKINIALSYDASGTRAAQDASWVGLGWSLAFGGGVITRTVRGLDDLYSGGYHFTQALPTDTQLQNFYNSNGFSDTDGSLRAYLMSVRNGLMDTEPDIFTYSFGDNNGKFVFDKTVSGSGVLQLESTNAKITYLNPGWKIIDGDGNNYYFNAQETATDYSLSTDHEITYDAGINDLTDENLNRHGIVTAWYLDSIVTATSQKIIFSYTNEQNVSLLSKSEQRFTRLSNPSTCSPAELDTYSASRQLLESKQPDQILFTNGSIEFHKSSRSDVKDANGAYTSSRLAYIVEKDKAGVVIKRIDLYHSYYNANDPDVVNKRLKLDSIKDVTSPTQPMPPYKFSYFNPNTLPPKYTKAIDHWGYFNNQTGNASLLPSTVTLTPYYKSFTGANRQSDTNLASVQNGVLSSIVYPTGGRTDFTYELNEYTNLYDEDQYNSKDTTLSLGTITPNSPDKTGNFTLTENVTEVKFFFNYYDPNDLSHRDEFVADYAYLSKDNQPYHTFHNAPNGTDVTDETLLLSPGHYTMRLSSLPNYNSAFSATWTARTPLTKRKGGGLRVQRIVNMDGLGNQIVKKYLYDRDGFSSGLLLLPVKYDFITIVGGTDACGENMSSVYFVRYSNTINSLGFTKGGLIGYSKVTELSGEQGENGKTEYYFSNKAIQGLVTPSVPVDADPLNGRMLAVKYYDNTNKLLKKVENQYALDWGSANPLLPAIKLLTVPFTSTGFYTNTYTNASYWITQKKESVADYIGVDSVVTVRNFYYQNAVHRQLTKKEEQSSSGKLLTTQMKYADDLKSAGTPNVYNTMSNRNMHNPLIEQSAYENDVFLQSITNTYDYWKNGSWGDNTASMIVPRTIETKVLSNNAETRIRNYAYDNYGNLLEQSSLNGPHVTYLWGYNRQYPIAAVKNATYQDVVNALGQPQLDLLNTNPGSDSNVRSVLAPLRSALPKTELTIYTYTPLIGITSMTDGKRMTTTYEYDGLQRLMNVKDKDGNIVKHMDYHYQGQ
ncbi:hypothetical protein [Mucilaginibacter sp. NFR10]|uniref:hypothetical protein n=1 Tax=Mucilaginibacter sp. NFR10 TaxID=1566292 RepID=UPI00087160E4|nr:hypothetical protein [Mucilaginibacter sp. NFR10]SCW65897.1 hypothetical protein SAMN03159284_02893 [Mucilaginibacter sp. NFR10]